MRRTTKALAALAPTLTAFVSRVAVENDEELMYQANEMLCGEFGDEDQSVQAIDDIHNALKKALAR